jgi:hypothetical protein
MICWYCYWGWSKPVKDIYNKYINIAGESAMHYGAAHIVWDDENFEREHIKWCLDNFEIGKREDSTDEENKATKQSLIDLLELPDDILCPEPEDYDGIHPENYPPTIEVSK